MTPTTHPSDSPTPLTEEGKLQSEFRDADQCYTFAKRLDDEDKKTLSPRRRQIMAMKNGYAPWNAAQRKGGQSNLNFLEGEQALDTRRIPYIRRLTESQLLFDFDIKKDIELDYLDDLVRQLSDCASSTLRKWRGHFQQFLRIFTDMIDFGLGVAMWQDATDPRFKRVPRWNIFFEAEAEPIIEDQQVVVVRDKWTAKRILQAIDHPDAAKLGYQKENLRDALRHLHHEQGIENIDHTKIEELEEDIRRNQYGATALPPLTVYQVLFKDLETDKINSYVVAEVTTHKAGSSERKSQSVYLRKHIGAYDSLSNVIALFPLPSADTIQGLRGHGHRIYPKAIASSRAKNMALDNHAFETTRFFQGASGSGNMRLQIRKQGPYGIMEPEVTPVEMPRRDVLALDSFAIGFLTEEMRRGMSGNPLTRNPQTSSSPERHRSKFQEQADLLDDNGLSEVEIGTFDFYLDAALGEFYRRLTLPLNSGPGDDLRQMFRDNVEIYEIPETIWKDPGQGAVQSLRSVGSGSVMDQLLRSEKLLAIAGSLGERGAHEVLEYFLSVLVGPRNVRRFLKEFERLGGKTEQHWVAQMETNMALQGMPLLRPAGDQKDDSHLRQHIEGVMPQLTAATEGQMELPDVVQFVTGLDILLPHMDIHLARLERDETKKAQFDEHRRAVEELRRHYNSLRALAEQAIQAQANEAQRQAEEQALAEQGPQIDPKVGQKLLESQAQHEQKMSQRQDNFERIQGERNAAHQIGEQRKDASFVRQEQRKDGSVIRQEQRKDLETVRSTQRQDES